MKCPNCGADVKGRYCEYCGSELPEEKPQTVINNYYYGNPEKTVVKERVVVVDRTVSDKSKAVALALCIFLGYFGAHQFYVGKKGKGWLYLFTVGLCGIGWIVDIFSIASGNFRDANGLKLVGRGNVIEKSYSETGEASEKRRTKSTVFFGLAAFGLAAIIIEVMNGDFEGIAIFVVWTLAFGYLWKQRRREENEDK